MAVTDGREC